MFVTVCEYGLRMLSSLHFFVRLSVVSSSQSETGILATNKSPLSYVLMLYAGKS